VTADELTRRFSSFGPVLGVELIPTKDAEYSAPTSDLSAQPLCSGFAYLNVGPGFALQRCNVSLRVLVVSRCAML
jgi:hypothetical protein